MNIRRPLLLATLAGGGLFVAFASGAVPLVTTAFHTAEGAGRQALVMAADSHGREQVDRHQKRSAKHDRGERDGSDEHHGRNRQDAERQAGNGPAKAGTATPPDNGLILKGTTPKVQVN